MVEDHDIQWGSFEGVIEEGSYGAGQVIVWDTGTYIPDEKDMGPFSTRAEAEELVRRGLAQGKLSVILEGAKMKGSWALVKMRRTENDWLLLKHRDEFADPEKDILQDGRSVLSGRTIEEVTGGE
jgi:bifunctional non-homologous end joining protein LigD